MIQKRYDDYKHVMQDTGNLYLGAKFNYSELIEDEDVPFKFKMIIERYLLKDIEQETTLESQFYFMEPTGFEFECFKHLKTKVKVSMLVEKKNLFGKTKTHYQDHVYGISEFVKLGEEWKKKHGIYIQEIMISKLSMMTFSL